MTVQMLLNGKSQSVEVKDGNEPLLWILRDILGLKGTKFGCGKAACGACTILLDGEAIRCCTYPVKFAEGKDIVTIEGLGTPDAPHPVQQAWIEEIVPQCGYCQPGQIMKAADLLAQNPNPSTEQIDSALRGNLCRCGTYKRIRLAVADAAKQMKGA